ncbi:hypothetical protein C8T65DRAFT_694716 [Cerioporus squamosus]|nr:hypothetical protein C8T65DRAFT_694716 [Cerioporus squamosus]
MPSLVTVSDSEPGVTVSDSEPGVTDDIDESDYDMLPVRDLAHSIDTFFLCSGVPRHDHWTSPRSRHSILAQLHITVKYPTLLAEVVGRRLLELEVVDRVHAERYKINLPTNLTAMRALPPTVWNAFWANIMNSRIYAHLNNAQCDAIKTILYLYKFYSALHSLASDTWDDFLDRILAAAEMCEYIDTPVEEAIYDIKLWAMDAVPDTFPADDLEDDLSLGDVESDGEKGLDGEKESDEVEGTHQEAGSTSNSDSEGI